MSPKNRLHLRENFAFLLDGCRKYEPTVFVLFALFTVCSALLPFVSVLLPKVLVAGLEQKWALNRILLSAGMLGAAGMALGGGQAWAQAMFSVRVISVRLKMCSVYNAKVMRMRFDRIEDPEELKRIALSRQAFWGNDYGVEGVMHKIFDNVGVLISLLGLAAMLTALHPAVALIVAASAGICGFTLPSRDLSDAIRVWRFALAILAGVGGLFALTAGGVLLLIHLSGLTSLDVSYLTPFSDARAARTILRPRLIRQKWREAALRPQDLRNQGDGI